VEIMLQGRTHGPQSFPNKFQYGRLNGVGEIKHLPGQLLVERLKGILTVLNMETVRMDLSTDLFSGLPCLQAWGRATAKLFYGARPVGEVVIHGLIIQEIVLEHVTLLD